MQCSLSSGLAARSPALCSQLPAAVRTAAGITGQCMLSISATTPGDTDYLNLNELLLFDLSGSQLPASSLTVYLSSVLDGNPGQCIDGGCSNIAACQSATASGYRHGHNWCSQNPASALRQPKQWPALAGDNATFCSTSAGSADGNPQIHVAYPCAGGSTSLSKVGPLRLPHQAGLRNQWTCGTGDRRCHRHPAGRSLPAMHTSDAAPCRRVRASSPCAAAGGGRQPPRRNRAGADQQVHAEIPGRQPAARCSQLCIRRCKLDLHRLGWVMLPACA